MATFVDDLIYVLPMEILYSIPDAKPIPDILSGSLKGMGKKTSKTLYLSSREVKTNPT